MVRICCLSDIHGHLPDVPDCDLLLLGGDYCPSTQVEKWWYHVNFAPWLKRLSERMKVIGVAGNHDFMFQDHPDSLPKLDWTYLEDSGTEFEGLKVWGSPWQPRFYDWAFNADEPDLERMWTKIPDDTDILLLHGPPHGYGDLARKQHKKTDDDTQWPETEHTGSPSLTKRILEIKPKLVVAGHIHSGHGRYKIGESTLFVNASLVNERYNPTYDIEVVELEIA